ncbi:MAG: aminoacetone oxidase family FAD-binding enzyme [Oscillospiraceae bacterium]|nr:aminoacetone oxidase family FAD-binding enzyme [Oscillospiraceae bacterium]
METVVIIGGGASGMAAALTAAETPGRRVVLLERQQRVGRKLLATGNGRCNLTNTGAAPENYHGENPDFVLPALRAFPPSAAIAWFRGLGLVTVEEYGGRVYPLSNAANSVVDVLRFQLEQSGVEVKTACPVRELLRAGTGYTVVTDGERLCADKVIVACGGAAGAKLGGVMDGYALLKPLGHKRTALYPALVQLVTAPEYPRALKGVRADCALRLLLGGELLAESAGELQFTETGVSGPAAFDVSRAASLGGKGLTLSADFLRGYDAAAVLDMLKTRRESLPALPAAELLTGIVHNRLGKMLVKYAGLDAAAPVGDLTDGALAAVAAACKDFRLAVQGTEGFDSAQVTVGGIKTGGFNPETLESWFMPGLFVCGELLDVDGDCGGFNLQWAWASGRLAGRLGT